jgi:hypothetical protein
MLFALSTIMVIRMPGTLLFNPGNLQFFFTSPQKLLH